MQKKSQIKESIPSYKTIKRKGDLSLEKGELWEAIERYKNIRDTEGLKNVVKEAMSKGMIEIAAEAYQKGNFFKKD